MPSPRSAFSVPRSAFTLVELLVVIAIIGILIALMLPAIQASRGTANRTTCLNQITQLGVGIQNYQMAHEVYPPGTLESKGPIHSVPKGDHRNWIIHILPFIEETNAYRHIDQSVGVYHANNAPVKSADLSILICPSESANPSGASNYAAVHHDVEAPIDVDNHGSFFLNSRLRYDDLTDGASHTLFLGEKRIEPNDLGWMSGTRATLRNTGWPLNSGVPGAAPWFVPPANPGDDGSGDGQATDDKPTDSAQTDAKAADENPAQEKADSDTPADTSSECAIEMGGASPPGTGVWIAPGITLTGPAAGDPTLYVGGFNSHHLGGVNFAFGDGSARFLSDTMSLQVLQQLAHRSDGKLLPPVY